MMRCLKEYESVTNIEEFWVNKSVYMGPSVKIRRKKNSKQLL